MRFAFVFILAVAICGPIVALLWWAIAAKVAPYEDEVRRAASKQDRDAEAKVVRNFDKPPPPEKP